jgi:hypothetical protein
VAEEITLERDIDAVLGRMRAFEADALEQELEASAVEPDDEDEGAEDDGSEDDGSEDAGTEEDE